MLVVLLFLVLVGDSLRLVEEFDGVEMFRYRRICLGLVLTRKLSIFMVFLTTLRVRLDFVLPCTLLLGRLWRRLCLLGG